MERIHWFLLSTMKRRLTFESRGTAYRRPSFNALSSEMNMRPWKIIKSEYLLRDKWLTVRADNCKTADGLSVSPYYVLEYSDWVHVIALDSANHE